MIGICVHLWWTFKHMILYSEGCLSAEDKKKSQNWAEEDFLDWSEQNFLEQH